MKCVFVIFAVAVVYASAVPWAKAPKTRASLTAQSQWTAMVSGLTLVTAPAKLKLSQVAVMQMLTLSYWFTGTTSTLQMNIDAGATLGTAISGAMSLGFPATQVTQIQGYVQTAVDRMKVSVKAVKAVNSAQGKALEEEMKKIESDFAVIITQMQSVAASASVFSTLFIIVSDATLNQLTATVQAVAVLQNAAGEQYSDGNSASNVPALLMDIVVATTQPAREAAAVIVQQTVAVSVSVSSSTTQTAIAIQTSAMASDNVTAEASMNSVAAATSASYAVMIVSIQYTQEFDVTVITTGVAEIEEGAAAASNETVANITEASTELNELCSNTTEIDEISDTANNATANITLVMTQSANLTVQMCATVAIQAIIVEQSRGKNGIGQCVSEGKREKDKDMQDIQQNYTSSMAENQQNLTTCVTRYSDPEYSGNSSSNSDSGSTKTKKIDSCQRRKTDKDMKKHKDNSDKKCKKHKKGGENYEKVKKCKEDRKKETVTSITTIEAEFTMCIQMGVM